MGQLIWRYHPETRRYEVFAEGGGNAFGVEIDAKGRILLGPQRRRYAGLPLRPGRLLPEGLQQAWPALEPVRVRLLSGDEARPRPAVHPHLRLLRGRRVPRALPRAPVRRRAPAQPRRDERGPPRRLLVPDAGRRAGRVVVRPLVPAGGYQARTRRRALHRRLVRSPGQSLPQPRGPDRPGQRADLSPEGQGCASAIPAHRPGGAGFSRARRSPVRPQQVDSPDGPPANRRSQGRLARAGAQTSPPGRKCPEPARAWSRSGRSTWSAAWTSRPHWRRSNTRIPTSGSGRRG